MQLQTITLQGFLFLKEQGILLYGSTSTLCRYITFLFHRLPLISDRQLLYPQTNADMSEPMDIGPTKVSKRRRASDDSGGDDGPPPKMNRIAGMYIGPNHLRSEEPDRSEPPMSDASSKEESHTERRESPTRCNRIWQNTGGWSFRDVDQRITAEQQKQWLASNNSWKYGLKQHWKGVKVLGIGGYGLVGLWEYQKGKDYVHSVVVKQSKGKDPSLKNESQILHLISKSKTKHVVKLLKQYHVERGKGTSKKFDPNDDYASRIYLEYCKNGDMQGLIRKLYKYVDPGAYFRWDAVRLIDAGLLKEIENYSQKLSSGQYGSVWLGACAFYRIAPRT
jgi:hypothetical protein